MLHCWKYKRKLSPYLDRSLPTAQYRELWRHLHHCDECADSLDQMETLRTELRALPSPAIPADLAFEIKVRVSQERCRQEEPSLYWKWRERWGSLAAPAVAGVVCAMVFFFVFAAHVAVPRISDPDVPLTLRTPARLVGTGPLELGLRNENLVVQVLVDRDGRVADFDIISGSYTAQDVRDLRNRLLFTRFDPAMVFGQPTPERMLLAFSSVRVGG